MVTAQRGSCRSRASESRRCASARWMAASPPRVAVETGIAWGPAVESTATVPSGQSGSIRGDAVLPEVVEVERAHQLADLALARVAHVVEVGAQPHDVVLGLLVLAGARLGHGQQLDHVVEEARVEVAPCALHREVVQVLGGERVESVVIGHGAEPTGAWSPGARAAGCRARAARRSPRGPSGRPSRV